ncbi:MAG: hypothetical protein Q9186_003809 [Xanthomendoza sp. 1 TL-2023]
MDDNSSDFDFDLDEEKKGSVEDIDLKEVVLATTSGSHPGYPLPTRRVYLKAREWGPKYFFWVLDLGLDKYIMKAFGGVFRRCRGFSEKNKLLCEDKTFAYPALGNSNRYSNYRTNSNAATPEHFMQADLFQRSGTAPVVTKKRRGSQTNGENLGRKRLICDPVAALSDVARIVQEDRVYYDGKNERPPYVGRSAGPNQFVAVLADENERRTDQQLRVFAQHWSDGLRYWVAVIDGRKQIVHKCSGGNGGYRLRLWLGHKDYLEGDKIVVGYPAVELERSTSGKFRPADSPSWSTLSPTSPCQANMDTILGSSKQQAIPLREKRPIRGTPKASPLPDIIPSHEGQGEAISQESPAQSVRPQTRTSRKKSVAARLGEYQHTKNLRAPSEAVNSQAFDIIWANTSRTYDNIRHRESEQ